VTRPMHPWRCGWCGNEPTDEELADIREDLAKQHNEPPASWYCYSCAPDLKLTTSGLAWDVVEIGGASPENA
jgi:hypothetical protein